MRILSFTRSEPVKSLTNTILCEMISADKLMESSLQEQQKIVYKLVAENGKITSHQAETLLEVKQRRARTILSEMVDEGILERLQ